ncbi:MAG: sugar phosphate isomerase/epimerase, partial [Myxococcota bacterium]
MDCCLSTLLFLSRTLDAGVVSAIAAAGIGKVELFMQRPHLDAADHDCVRAAAVILDGAGVRAVSAHMPIYTERLIDRAARKGLSLSLSSADRAVRDRAAAELASAVEACRVLGVRNIVVHTGLGGDCGTDDRSVDRCVTALKGPGRMARELGINLALENGTEPGVTVDLLQKVLEGLDLSNAGICIDVGHSNLYGSPLEDSGRGGGRVFSQHLHDND